MYERKSRLTPRQQGRLIDYFVAGATARAASEVVGVNVKVATAFYLRLRQLIASKLPSYELSGEVEADESYFGGRRKDRRGRGAAGKVYTAIIPNAKTETLLPFIKEKVRPESIVYTDTFRSYNALDVSDFHHMRINHTELFADRQNHINGIENFWN